ncbi:unnamed protein product [Paramecium sonneborni]|uniref:Uncharacterized protein n=1 Tax=Paramecium sonneborni TaxID=65129 RepID=A0A8S1RUB7_9CILI|nr:unnamed protein product [Paramecium sonneborni]
MICVINDHLEAIQYLDQALKINPQHYLSLWVKGDCLMM